MNNLAWEKMWQCIDGEPQITRDFHAPKARKTAPKVNHQRRYRLLTTGGKCNGNNESR